MKNLFRKFRRLFNPIDLTKGQIVPTFLKFLIPIILSMIFQQIYTLTDTVIVGQTLDSASIAGINNSATLVFVILDFAIGCSSGFSVVVSEKFGEKNDDGARQSFLVQLVLGLIISIVLTLIGILLIPTMLGWLGITKSTTGSMMQAEYEAAYTYVVIIFSGILAQMFYNLIVAVLRARGDSFTPFLFLVFSTLLNVGLDLLFIVTFRWGVAGSAYATILSQTLAAIGCFIYAYKRYPELRIKKTDWKFSWKFVYKHLRLGVPLGFQFSILAIGIIVMSSAVIKFDRVPLADGTYELLSTMPSQIGYGAANKLLGLLMTPLNALGTGMLSYMGQNYGAKEYGRIQKGFKYSIVICLIEWLLLMSIGLLLTINGAYQHIFLAGDKITEESIEYGNNYLFVSLPCLGFLAVLFVSRNVLQGLQKPLFPFLAGVAELCVRTFICGVLPQLVTGAVITSSTPFEIYLLVCAADPITWCISSLILTIPVLVVIFKKMPKLSNQQEGDQLAK